MVKDCIGASGNRATAILRSCGLTPFREVLTRDSFRQARDAPVTPKTILIPEVVFWLMATVAMGEGSMTAGIVSFWASIRASFPHLRVTPITEEAFTMARKALPLRFFLRLFSGLVERFGQEFSESFRWKGLRLFGIDGMDFELPPNPHLRKVFPGSPNQYGAAPRPKARLVGLVGLWDGLAHYFRLTGMDTPEQVSARRLIRFLQPTDLLLCDRSFPGLATFAAVLARGANFLFHLPSSRFLKKARRPTASGRTDEWCCLLKLPVALRRQFPQLGPALEVRILQYQRPGFRVSWLITSLLDVEQFSYEELVDLYHHRWRQETFHREWKYTLQLSNLRSHTAAGILKEVLVQLTLNNAVRWIMAQACRKGPRPVDLQFRAAKRLIVASITVMTVASVHRLPEIFQTLLLAIGRHRIHVRPGRAYPRKWDNRARPQGHGRYVQPARIIPVQEVALDPI